MAPSRCTSVVGGIIGFGKNQAARLNSLADSLVIRYRCIGVGGSNEILPPGGRGGGGGDAGLEMAAKKRGEGRLAPRRHRIGRAWRKYARHIALANGASNPIEIAVGTCASKSVPPIRGPHVSAIRENRSLRLRGKKFFEMKEWEWILDFGHTFCSLETWVLASIYEKLLTSYVCVIFLTRRNYLT